MKTATTHVTVNFKGLRRILHNAQVMPAGLPEDLIYLPKAWVSRMDAEVTPDDIIGNKLGFSEKSFPPGLWHETHRYHKDADNTVLIIDKVGDDKWKITVHTGERNTAPASYYKLVLEERANRGSGDVIPMIKAK